MYIKVTEIMHNAVTIDMTASVSEAATIMREKGMGSIIAVSDGKPVGMLTDRDIVSKVVAEGKNPESTTIQDAMTTPFIYCNTNVTIDQVAKKFGELQIRRMPVMKGFELVGMVSEKDVLRSFPELFEVSRAMKDLSTIKGFREGRIRSGRCASCRNFTYDLLEVEGQLLCEECR